MSATADPLYASLCLLGSIALLPDFNPRRVFVSAICFALALLSKENAIVFPLLAASLFYLKSDQRFNIRAYLRFWPYGIVIAAYLVAHYMLPLHDMPQVKPPSAAPDGSASSSLMPFATLPIYARLILWPSPLFMEHTAALAEPFQAAAIAAGLAMVILASMQIFQKPKASNLPLSWGLLWFCGAHLLVFYVDAIVYEHWMYLPTIGLALGVAQTLADKIWSSTWKQKPLAVYGVSSVVVVAAVIFGYLTYEQNRVWADPVTFYQHILDQGHPAPKAHANLGLYYTKNGNYPEALKQFESAVRESGDTEAAVHNNIAVALESMPDHDQHSDEILKHFQRALAIDPDNYMALVNLAAYYDAQDDADHAAIYRERADAVRNRFQTFSSTQTKDQP